MPLLLLPPSLTRISRAGRCTFRLRLRLRFLRHLHLQLPPAAPRRHGRRGGASFPDARSAPRHLSTLPSPSTSSGTPTSSPPSAPAHSASSGSSSSSMHVSLVTRPSRLRLRGIWFPSTDASIGHLLPSSTHTHTHPHTHTHATLDPSFFSPPPPKGANSTDPISDSERALRLGSTIRILRARLPTYLQTPPPPTEILSPRISLHLFPSTHPHLPAVRGRVAYLAALWTAPVVWGRVPIVGNVKLEVLSERMWKGRAGGRPTDETGEKWVVKWRTIGNGKRMWSETTTAATTATTASTPPTPSSSSSEETDDDNEFTGLFIFTFDAHGRIRSHTIENVQACGTEEDDEDRKYSSVMTLTDWLLRRVGRAGGGVEGAPGVASVDVGVGRGLGYCWTVRMGGKDGWTTRTMRTGRR